MPGTIKSFLLIYYRSFIEIVENRTIITVFRLQPSSENIHPDRLNVELSTIMIACRMNSETSAYSTVREEAVLPPEPAKYSGSNRTVSCHNLYPIPLDVLPRRIRGERLCWQYNYY